MTGEVAICLDCGTPMLNEGGKLYCPKCEVADDLVVADVWEPTRLDADDQAVVNEALDRSELRALKKSLADDGLDLGGH